MEVYDASGQCVIMADWQLRMSLTQYGDLYNDTADLILYIKFSHVIFDMSDKTKRKEFSGIQAKSGPHVEDESSALSPVPGLCARVQAFRLGRSVS